MTGLKAIARQLREAEEPEQTDDLFGMKMSDLKTIAFPYGTRVRILVGKYTGELGTVREATLTMTAEEGDRNYWVHLDGDEDPLSAIVYRPDQITRAVQENEEEFDESPKELGQGYPRFEYEVGGFVFDMRFTYVKADNGVFLGTLVETKNPKQWFIAFVAQKNLQTHVEVASQEDGARKLWEDYIGVREVSRITTPYEPLPAPPDDENHYENFGKWMVNFLSEESNDTVVENKQTKSLRSAGFMVESDERTITVSWPAPDMTTYLAGVKRAKELLLKEYSVVSSTIKNSTAVLKAVPVTVTARKD